MIKTDNLVKDYGLLRAVDHINFEVKKGEVLGFLGPNGAGKSTTMKMITGFLPPTSGTAFVGDYNIRKNPLGAKKLLGYLPESGPLYGEMTVIEFLKFCCDLRDLKGLQGKSAIERVLAICHLEAVLDQPIETLSKGYRQRVGLAQAVLHDPPCLILDEPTDGLDPNQKHEVRQLISSMAESKAIVLSTHILEEVEAMCNRVIIIDHGKKIVDETPQQLRARHSGHNAMLAVYRDADQARIQQELKTLPSVQEIVVLEDGGIHIFPKDHHSVARDILEDTFKNNWELTILEPLPVKLEEVFHQLTLGEHASKPEASTSNS